MHGWLAMSNEFTKTLAHQMIRIQFSFFSFKVIFNTINTYAQRYPGISSSTREIKPVKSSCST